MNDEYGEIRELLGLAAPAEGDAAVSGPTPTVFTRPAYDATHFNPPAPLAQVALRNPSTGVTVSDVMLLVDGGADVTVLPRQPVEGLGISLATGQGYEIAGFDGNKSFVPAVELDMLFLKRVFKGQYLVIDEERGVLDRDVLNHLYFGARWGHALDGTNTRRSLAIAESGKSRPLARRPDTGRRIRNGTKCSQNRVRALANSALPSAPPSKFSRRPVRRSHTST